MQKVNIKGPHYQGTTESEKSVSKGRQACSINTAKQIKPIKNECLYLLCKKEVKPDPNHWKCPTKMPYRMDKTIGTHGDSINCLIKWIPSPWISFYLQRAHRPIFLHFHLWQKWAPLQSSAARRRENWIQRHWKRNQVFPLSEHILYTYIYTHTPGATVKPCNS